MEHFYGHIGERDCVSAAGFVAVRRNNPFSSVEVNLGTPRADCFVDANAKEQLQSERVSNSQRDSRRLQCLPKP